MTREELARKHARERLDHEMLLAEHQRYLRDKPPDMSNHAFRTLQIEHGGPSSRGGGGGGKFEDGGDWGDKFQDGSSVDIMSLAEWARLQQQQSKKRPPPPPPPEYDDPADPSKFRRAT